MWDIDFILGLDRTSSDSNKPYLVEAGTRHRAGKPEKRFFVWSTGRIGACLGSDEITISRQFGLMGDCGVVLSFEEFRQLCAACSDWKARCEQWSAFWSSTSGYVMGGAWYYQAPGPDSPEVRIGRNVMDRSEGEEFVGENVFREFHISSFANRPSIVAEIWREGEKYGDPSGEKVGVVYGLGPDARLEAETHGARLLIRGKWIGVEPWDDEFFFEMLAVLDNR